MPPTAPVNQSIDAPVVLEALDGVRRRIKTFSLIFGVGVVLAATVGLLLLTVFLDYLLDLPGPARLVFILGAMAGIVYTVWNYVAKPLAARLTINEVAGHLEVVFPQFGDRLRSMVDFVRGDVPGSKVMKERMVTEATQLAATVDLNSALLRKPPVYSMSIGIGAVVLTILLALLFSPFSRIAISRLLMVNPEAWPKRVQIHVTSEIPRKAQVGQRIELRMKLDKGDKPSMKPIAYYQYDNGVVQQQIMIRNADDTFSVNIDAKGEGMKVWISAGDDKTEQVAIAVVPKLAVLRVQGDMTPPAYSKLGTFSVNLADAPAVVTIGSQVKLEIHFNKHLDASKPVSIEPLALSSSKDAKAPALPEIQWERKGADVAVATWIAEESLRFRINATDYDGFENSSMAEYDVTVRPDQAPTVIIELPRGNEERPAEGKVRLEALADDDFDITTMTLVVDRSGDKKHWEIPLSGWFKVDTTGERRRFRIKHEWHLSQLADADLQPGDVLEYYIQVQDNYNYNGAVHEPVASGKLRIHIISQDAADEKIAGIIRQIGNAVKGSQNTQETIKNEGKELSEGMQKKEEPDAGDKATIGRLQEQERQLAAQTDRHAEALKDVQTALDDNASKNEALKDIAKNAEKSLQQASRDAMPKAAQQLANAQQAAAKSGKNQEPGEKQKNDQQRNEAMKEAEKQQEQAKEKLGEALNELEKVSSPFKKMMDEVRAALENQQKVSKETAEAGKETIGKKPEELTPEQKEKLDKIADAQQKASEAAAKLQQQLAENAKKTEKSDPSASKAMEQAAKQSQSQQVPGSQSQAAESAKKNQQAQAQAKQKQAELGLQMMLDTMRDAQKEKLKELAAKLKKLQEQIDELVRRQAGHNIDNLRIQGGEKEKTLITEELLAKAQRELDKQPRLPDVPVLTGSQAQTEANTRDIGKTAQDTDGGGPDIAAALNKAAGFMERAIVSLKETKVPEAYDPSKVSALAALDTAKQKVDEAAAKVQDQLDEAKAETIRQLLEAIRKEQFDNINLPTVKIDNAARGADGQFKREEGMELRRLSEEQAKLSERMKKMEDALRDLGGIVYRWAGRDIVDTMNDVKEDLTKLVTGKPTQAEQARIVAQLDDMIKNLALKKLEKEFEDGGGGGGGKGGGPPPPPKPELPTEAELRLLKAFQQAINDATKVIHEQPQVDKPKAVGLGGRQGELRNLLDELLTKASKGEIKLDPEPDPKERLPEEAGQEDVENQEIDDFLKGGKPEADKTLDDVKMSGQRMSRSRIRLQDYDAGKTTQIIQEKIVASLDQLAEMARQQQAQQKPKPSQGGGGKAEKPGAGEGSGGQQAAGKGEGEGEGEGGESSPSKGGGQGAKQEKGGGSADNTARNLTDILDPRDTAFNLTPRERDALIDGSTDEAVPKYKRIIDDYYKAMNERKIDR